MLIGGVVGSYIVGPILGKTRAFKLFLIGIPLCASASLILFNYTLALDQFWVIIITSALVGATILPAIPLTLELGAEMTFPVSAANSSGMLYMAGQFHSFSITMSIQAIMTSLNGDGEHLGTTIGIWIGTGMGLVAAALGVWIKRKWSHI